MDNKQYIEKVMSLLNTKFNDVFKKFPQETLKATVREVNNSLSVIELQTAPVIDESYLIISLDFNHYSDRNDIEYYVVIKACIEKHKNNPDTILTITPLNFFKGSSLEECVNRTEKVLDRVAKRVENYL